MVMDDDCCWKVGFYGLFWWFGKLKDLFRFDVFFFGVYFK